MIRRNIFQACGGFDRGYFMYAEDVDLCYRVTQQGFQVVHAGTATVLHHGGQSSQGQAQSAAFSVVLTRESIYRFMKLHYGRVYAMAYRASTALSAIIRMLVLERDGGGRTPKQRRALGPKVVANPCAGA